MELHIGSKKCGDYPVEAVMDRYCFFRQKYVFMRPDFTKHMAAPYTSRQVWEHLNGSMSLCVFAGPSNTSFLTFDIDLRNPDVVRRVVDTLAELGVPREKIYVSDSGGKGYHVDIFFANSIYNWKAKELYDLVIYFGGLNPRKVEYRPTARQAIKLPLGVHQKTGRRCWFVNRETLEPIEDMGYIDQTGKVEVWRVEEILREGNRRRFYRMLGEIEEETNSPTQDRYEKRTDTECNKRGERSEREPSRITEPGTRQKLMITEALRLYREGGDYGSIHAGLIDWLAAQDRRMYKDSWDECMRNVNNITAWVMRCGRRRELGEDKTHEYRGTKMRVYESDVRRILLGPTKTARLLAFLITIYCDRYEFCGMGVKRFCDELGVKTKDTIIAAANALVAAGLFSRTNGGLRNTGGGLQKVTNKYRFPAGYKRGGEYVEIDGAVTGENIYEMYIRTVAALCGGCDLSGLTKNELADIKEIEG